MKKDNNKDMRSEYKRKDLGVGVRGKYFKEYQAGTNLVLLSPEVAKAFPTEESVNAALRSLIEVAKRTTTKSKPANHTPN